MGRAIKTLMLVNVDQLSRIVIHRRGGRRHLGSAFGIVIDFRRGGFASPPSALTAEFLEGDAGWVAGVCQAGAGDVLERVADAAELDGVDAALGVEQAAGAGEAIGGDDGGRRR